MHYLDIGGRHAQRIRHHLGKDRRGALAMWGEPSLDRDLARRLNDDPRVIGQARDTAAGALDDRGQADANARCSRDAWLTSLGAPVVVVRQLQGAVQSARSY